MFDGEGRRYRVNVTTLFRINPLHSLCALPLLFKMSKPVENHALLVLE